MTPDGDTIKLNIWDTAGQEKYQAINRNLYLGADGAVICYDLTTKFAVEKVDYWKKELQENAGQRCAITIIGTKNDSDVLLDTRLRLEEYAIQNNFPFAETSAKYGVNVKEAFGIAINEIEKSQPGTNPTERKSLGATAGNGGNGKTCC